MLHVAVTRCFLRLSESFLLAVLVDSGLQNFSYTALFLLLLFIYFTHLSPVNVEHV